MKDEYRGDRPTKYKCHKFCAEHLEPCGKKKGHKDRCECRKE